MDRLKAMRQRDWARVFGVLCVVVGLGLSVAGYDGAQWDALILCLGALMLLRAAVEGASPSRAAGLLRAGRVVVFMFAFAAVNRAQGGVEGAVSGALGNWILWAVAGVLFALPLFRRGLPWGRWNGAVIELVSLVGVGAFFWFYFGWREGSVDNAALRTLVVVAAVANAVPFLEPKEQRLLAGLVGGLVLSVGFVTPGEALWPVMLGVLPVTLGFAWFRQDRKTPPRT